MHLADKDSVLRGFVTQPVNITLGNQIISERVYVAPIKDEMLLGHDLLHHLGALLDLQNDSLIVNGESIPLTTVFKDSKPSVARVAMSRRIVIPPNTVVKVKCQLASELNDYYIEPVNSLKVAMPKVVRAAKEEPVVCLLNMSEYFRTMKKGQVIGTAFEIAEVLGEQTASQGLKTMNIPTVDQSRKQSQMVSNLSVVSEDLKESNDSIKPGAEDSGLASSLPRSRTDNKQSSLPVVPDHLQDVFDRSKNLLNIGETQKLQNLLCQNEDVFAKHQFDLGKFNALEHTIDTGDARPVKSGMRRTPACFVGEEEAHLKQMLDAGVIQESMSEWCSAPVLIRKRDGTVRWCIDYRRLNDVTVKDQFPLPLVDDCLDTLAGNVWFSKLDANAAYWQIKIREQDRSKTAFVTKYGLYEHVRMGYGLTGAPATFSRAVGLILRGLTWKTVLAFLDDILILGSSFDDHLKNLSETLGRFRKYGLKLKAKKCVFFQKEVEFLGRIVGDNKLAMSQKDTKAVEEWPVPKCTKEVERFLGFVNYHRSFLKDFAYLAKPLYGLTGKNQFKWGDREQGAFEALRQALVKPPVLALPNKWDPFILDCDASDVALGGVLSQVQNGDERVIAYASFTLTPEQKRYCTTRKELLSIVRLTRQFKYYLLGRYFKVRTDHASLTWLLRFKDPQGQLARWIEELGQFHMIVKHRPGSKHENADGASRIPETLSPCPSYVAGIKLKDLPCGGCHYCTRADQQWGEFIEEVDDAVGLAETAVSAAFLGGSRIPKGNRNQTVSDGSRSSTTNCSEPEIEQCFISTDQNDKQCFISTENSRQNIDIDGDDFLSLTHAVGMDIGHTDAHFEILNMNSGVEVTVSATQLQPDSTSQACCWGFTFEELQDAQNEDENLKLLLDWLKEQKEPDQGTLFASSRQVKFFWINKGLFQLIDGVLFKQKKEILELELVVPKSLQLKAIELHHDIPSSGHQGIARTKAKLREKFFWYYLSGDVESYVLSCDVCSRNKKNKSYGRVPMTEYQAGVPMERVHIDFLGPLPKTANGHEHCLMMVDQFTKWVECVPLPSQKAEVTAKAAIDTFFTRFGYPFQLFSDQGRNFESKLFEAVCKALQIHKTRCTPYRPSANGQVERFNRTLIEAVRCFLGKSQDKWDQHVQQIAGAIRSSVNRSTGFTPNMLMLGREVNIPAQLMFPNTITHYEEVDEYVKDLSETMQKAHSEARKTLKTSTKRMKRDYDLRVLLRPYDRGDIVYLLDTASTKGKTKKLCCPWKGPAIITKKLTPYLYRVKLSNSVQVVNHDRMMPCRDRKIPAWIKRFQEGSSADDAEEEDDDREYCICRKPANGRFMIQCDFCDEWFHGSCVNVTATDALDIDKYRCINCKN